MSSIVSTRPHEADERSVEETSQALGMRDVRLWWSRARHARTRVKSCLEWIREHTGKHELTE